MATVALSKKSAPPAFVLGGLPRVNLMPRAEVARREQGRLLRRWAWGFVAALAVVALATAGAFYLSFAAQQRLDAANAATQSLLVELGGLTDVRAALELETSLEGFRVDAMATQVDWPELIDTLAKSLPDGAIASGFDVVTGAAPIGDDPAVEVGTTVTMTVTSAEVIDVVPLVRGVRATEGILDAEAWQVNTDEAGYSYLLKLTTDQSFYTGDYVAEDSE